jgi:hypothetical protein
MKAAFFYSALCLFLATGLAWKVPSKSFVVRYSTATPDSLIEAAKQKIVEAGGVVTHSYQLLFK